MNERTHGQLVATSAALWALSTGLMVVASMQDSNWMARWALLVGLWALLPTGWLMLDMERHRVETIARLLDREEKPEGLRRL